MFPISEFETRISTFNTSRCGEWIDWATGADNRGAGDQGNRYPPEALWEEISRDFLTGDRGLGCQIPFLLGPGGPGGGVR